jgi:phosphatidyl-myo-inositol dimannoside synthase
VFVGRLVPKKGLEHLLDALHQLRQAGVSFSAEIVGHGPLAGTLAEKTRTLGLDDRVRFAGPVSHDSLADHYQRAAIAVFPFVEAADGDQEGFGLVMVEAMGCGCAVIASDLPAVRERTMREAYGLAPSTASPTRCAPEARYWTAGPAPGAPTSGSRA